MTALEKYFLANLYTPENNALLEKLQPTLRDAFPYVVELFYSELQRDDSAKKFLDSEMVEKRLKAELKRWMEFTLSPKSGCEADKVVDLQRHVGEVHARIDVPMSIVDSAMLMVKNGCFRTLLESIEERNAVYDAVLLVNSILESSLSVINEAFMHGLVENERNAQSFRANMDTQELVLEVERVRTDLFNWLSATTLDLMTNLPVQSTSLARTDFSLWIHHKLELVCMDTEMTDRIKQTMEKMKNLIDSDNSDTRALCVELNKITNDMAWLLSEIASSVAADAAREDPLTRLIDRKYLSPVMQKETRLALLGQSSFAVIMMDIDHFKSINDLHGHHAGDKALSHVGALLRKAVRISDYCFRYGGEEFLVLLPECDAEGARSIAEKVRKAVESEAISVENNRHINLTASLGVSEFIGHPDYMETIKSADAALYAAKHNGRNRTIVSTNK